MVYVTGIGKVNKENSKYSGSKGHTWHNSWKLQGGKFWLSERRALAMGRVFQGCSVCTPIVVCHLDALRKSKKELSWAKGSQTPV